MAEKVFKFYPVGNGFSGLVTLDATTHILLDLNQKSEEEEQMQGPWADIHTDLLDVLPLVDGRPWLQVFAHSHPHQDHCLGFDRVFAADPWKDDDETKIGIGELWVTAALFEQDVDEPAALVQREAIRRLKLWADDAKAEEAKKLGNRLVVFGYSENEDILKLPEGQRYGAGQVVKTIAGQARDDFEFFVHWPFFIAVEEAAEGADKNEASLVGQMVLADQGSSTRLLFGGDSGCWVWETLYNKSEEKGNLVKLDWDIFIVPHHGSFGFFTNKTGDEGRTEARDNPNEACMSILAQGAAGGWIICPSRPIREKNYTDADPPHIQAIRHYRAQAEKLGKDRFVCLMEHPTEEAPEPFILKLTSTGLQRDETIGGASVASVGGKAASVLPRFG